jgi:hypothetical protein
MKRSLVLKAEAEARTTQGERFIDTSVRTVENSTTSPIIFI